MAIDWLEARQWLLDAQAVPAGSPLLSHNATVVDLATALQDGVLLCDLVNRYLPGCVPSCHRAPAHQVARFLACLSRCLVYVLSKHLCFLAGVHDRVRRA